MKRKFKVRYTRQTIRDGDSVIVATTDFQTAEIQPSLITGNFPEIGAVVTLKKHKDNKIDKSLLGDWTFMGVRPDGALVIHRYVK